MRVSGRGGTESLMFIAPAAIFGGFFVWMYGGPIDVLTWLDRVILHAGYAAWNFCAAVIQAVSNL